MRFNNQPITTAFNTAVLLAADDITLAVEIVVACESDLGRELSLGQQRDLLADNTAWQSNYIRAMVSHINKSVAQS